MKRIDCRCPCHINYGLVQHAFPCCDEAMGQLPAVVDTVEVKRDLLERAADALISNAGDAAMEGFESPMDLELAEELRQAARVGKA